MRPTWKGRGLPDEVAGNAGRSVTVVPTSTIGGGKVRPAEANADPRLIVENRCDYVTPRMDTNFGTFAPGSLDQSPPDRFGDRVCAIERAQFGENDLEALFDSDFAPPHCVPNLAIG
jgi:hypothetical protein